MDDEKEMGTMLSVKKYSVVKPKISSAKAKLFKGRLRSQSN